MKFLPCACCTRGDAVERGEIGVAAGDRTGAASVRSSERQGATDTSTPEGDDSGGLTFSGGGGSVYYDARQWESSAPGFEPLVLRSGVSLDVPPLVLGQTSGEAPPPPSDGRGPRDMSSKRKRSRIRSTLVLRKRLEETPKVVDTPAGYPGHLTSRELEACLEFRRRLKEGDQVYRDMVGCFSDVEEEAYAVCRYMRARKFDVDRVFQMMEERSELWKKGAVHDFFPSASDAIGGAPESALLTQFPLVLGRTARNGCPVIYFHVRKLRIEGIECVTSLDDIPNYIWHLAVHKLKRHVAKVLADDPSRFVRTQLMVVFDLKGLAMSTLRSAMGALQGALQVLGVFPEFLFNVVILNVPGFFGAFWPVIKNFLDPDTAKKFELYSSAAKGTERLLELVEQADLASDFGGEAPSTDVEAARQGEEGQAADRQVVELLTVHKRGNGVCKIKLKGNETASICIYTKAHDGADVRLCEDGKTEPIAVVSMTRNKEAAGSAFFRNVSSSLRGPGNYQIRVKRQLGSSSEHFLVTADINCG